jgi:hypothetical protein
LVQLTSQVADHFLRGSSTVVAGKQKGNAIEQSGDDAQLIIHREDGSIEIEYTYGHDPRRIPG